MKKLKWITIALALAVTPLMTVSDEEGKQKFEYLDHDGDGFIDRSEATSHAGLRQFWNNVDKNKDGKLTETEFMAFEQVPRDPYPEQ